jgi:hypothetical protein
MVGHLSAHDFPSQILGGISPTCRRVPWIFSVMTMSSVEQVGVLLQVLEVVADGRVQVTTCDLARHVLGHLGFVLDDAQECSDVVAFLTRVVRRRNRQLSVLQWVLHLDVLPSDTEDVRAVDAFEDQTLREDATQLHRTDAVACAARELALSVHLVPEAHLAEEPFREDRLLGDVDREIAVLELPLLDDGEVTAHSSEFDRVCVRMRLDGDPDDRASEGAHFASRM